MRPYHHTGRRFARLAGVAGLLSLAGVLASSAALAQTNSEEMRLHEEWSSAIQLTATPGLGCFRAAYPGLDWVAVPCLHIAYPKPHLSFSQRLALKRQRASGARNVGNGSDWVLSTGGKLIHTATGSFPTETGVTSETNPGSGGKNAFSLQLNANTFDTKICSGSKCQGWQQFYYGTGPYIIQMQAWLLDYSGKCKTLGTGWQNGGGGDCVYTTNATSVPKLLPTALTSVKLTATVVKDGNDTVIWTTPAEAYSNTQPDSVVYASQGWNQAEFNIVGNYNGTTANFNAGSAITVKITDSKTATPNCVNNGQTGEQNNLTLGKCKAGKGEVTFSESN